jgi:rhodanese-related sulfurtransferase/CBS domain-containing protein
MPTEIDRDQVRDLASRGTPIVEVLPAEDYRWAHLPGARNLPLHELDRRAGELDRSEPVVVYCNDTTCDMSPRAAWRLEALGFETVYDYVAGKMDWIAADLPYEGEAYLVHDVVRRRIAAVPESASVADARERRSAVGFGPVVVVNDAGVVAGSLYREPLEKADPTEPVTGVLRFGISTVHPSEPVGPLLERMNDADVGRMVVTRPDGTLVGLFVAADAAVARDGQRRVS